MKVIIVGAGQVGIALAKYLRTEDHAVVLIDTQKEALSHLAEQLDIQTIVGSGTSPTVLSRAGAKDADVLLAVTGNDNVNIICCVLAKTLFQVNKRVARLASSEYLDKKNAEFLKSLSIDVVVSPEQETAKRILADLTINGAMDVTSFCDNKVEFVGLKCRKNCALVGKTIRQIRELIANVNFTIVAVNHKNQLVDLKEASIKVGDDVYFFVAAGHLERVLDIFGYTMSMPDNVLIFGGGQIGYALGSFLEAPIDRQNVMIIEKSEERSEFLASHLNDALIIKGDGFDDKLLDEIEFKNYDVAVATTHTDENNVLLSLLAKRNGISRSCALIRNELYMNYVSGLGIDSFINPNAVMVSAILQHLRKGRVQDGYFLQSGLGELLQIEVLPTARITKNALEKIKIPKGITLGGVLRKGTFLCPDKELIVQAGDIAFVFVERGFVQEAEKLFTVELSFF
ncbi:MAG: Trk system potassium transporter TrkA [Alphaproteobacteria bacterium]|nr:Trk system potassium transporter TrkA [Alphaproteobacteria bacterium]